MAIAKQQELIDELVQRIDSLEKNDSSTVENK